MGKFPHIFFLLWPVKGLFPKSAGNRSPLKPPGESKIYKRNLSFGEKTDPILPKDAIHGRLKVGIIYRIFTYKVGTS